jgi:hypothetical protein
LDGNTIVDKSESGETYHWFFYAADAMYHKGMFTIPLKDLAYKDRPECITLQTTTKRSERERENETGGRKKMPRKSRSNIAQLTKDVEKVTLAKQQGLPDILEFL